MKNKPPLKYISRGIVLDEKTWREFNRLRKVHGSYNKTMRHLIANQKAAGSKLPGKSK